MPVPEFNNLGDIIRHDLDPRKIGLIDLGGEEGPREYSYAQMDGHIQSVARGLQALGLQRGQRIAILSANRAEFLFAYFGIMRAGLVAVPINYKFPRQMIEFVVRDSDAVLVFCDSQRALEVPEGVSKVVFHDKGSQGFEAFINPGTFLAVTPKPKEVGMYLYTSGSMGKPKGVMLSHESHIWVAKTRLGNNDWSAHRFLVAAPLYHMNALALAKLSMVAYATMVLLPQFTAKAYLVAIQKYRCTWLTSVPPMIAMMLQEKELVQKTDFSSVQFLRMGSAPVSNSLLDSIKQILPKVFVSNAYGTTEGGPVVFGPHPQGLIQPPLSVGYPHPEIQLRLVNGVLEMKSPGLMIGYHKAKERNPPLKNPFTPDGFYVTGDMFRSDDNGFYFFIGRSDDMFVSGGENIFPSEVERLLESHPSVQQAAVVPVEDEIKGQKPAAFIVIKPGSQLLAEDLKSFCLKNAPAYQHPRWIWFVNELPLASTNKIDKNLLCKQAKIQAANSA